MFVKVCGLTEKRYIDAAVELGFDAVGIVLYPKSPRYCPAENARRLAEYAPDSVATVAVSVSYADVKPVRDFFDYVQIYERMRLKNYMFASESPPPAHLILPR